MNSTVIHWARWIAAAGVVVTIGVAWIVWDIRRRIKTIKLSETIVINSEGADKILEAVQVVGVIQTANHIESQASIEATRVHITSNHDEIDGAMRPLVENTNWIKQKIDRLFKILARDMPEPPDVATRPPKLHAVPDPRDDRK